VPVGRSAPPKALEFHSLRDGRTAEAEASLGELPALQRREWYREIVRRFVGYLPHAWIRSSPRRCERAHHVPNEGDGTAGNAPVQGARIRGGIE